MTLKKHRHTLIYKTFLFIFILIIGNNCTSASELADDNYFSNSINYSTLNKIEVLEYADKTFNQALNSADTKEKEELYKIALGTYVVLNKMDSYSDYPIIQIARIYDYQNKDELAKSYFYQALKIHENCPLANLYLGDFYYRREYYHKALGYYRKALNDGVETDYKLSLNLGIIYEKLGDLMNAQIYYHKAYKNNPTEEVHSKIRNLDTNKYNETGYYKKNDN